MEFCDTGLAGVIAREVFRRVERCVGWPVTCERSQGATGSMKEVLWGVSGRFAHRPLHRLRSRRDRRLRTTSVTESAKIIAMSPTPWPEETTRAAAVGVRRAIPSSPVVGPASRMCAGGSRKRYGQMAPVVVCVCGGAFVLSKGFERLSTVRSINGFEAQPARDARDPGDVKRNRQK